MALQLHEKFIHSPAEQVLIGWLSLTKVCGFLQMYNVGTNGASLPGFTFCLPLGIGKTASAWGFFGGVLQYCHAILEEHCKNKRCLIHVSCASVHHFSV